MAQFDVYKNINPRTKRSVPYVLDVQADMFNSFVTRVVVPLVKVTKLTKPIKYLELQFVIEGKHVVMSTAELSGISISLLGEKVDNLAKFRSEIIAALDFLILGF